MADCADKVKIKGVALLFLTPPILEPPIFEEQEGKELGQCQICDQYNQVGKYCRWCCEAQRILLGVCRHCIERGPMGSICYECGTAFEEMVFGTVGNNCEVASDVELEENSHGEQEEESEEEGDEEEEEQMNLG
jgi:hypothetical protein